MQNIQFDVNIFNNFPDMCFLLSKDGKIKFINTASLENLNYNEKDFNIFFDYVELCDRSKAENIFLESLSEKKSSHLKTRLYAAKNLIDVSLSFVPLASNGETEFEDLTFVSARDIREEKQKEIELLRFYNVAENSVNPVQITDLNGKMIYVNEAFAKVSGYVREELIGKNPRIFGSGKNSSKFWDKMWHSISSGKVWVGEVENKRKDGQPFFTQILISPIVDKNKKVSGYFAIHRDLSEKRTMERQLIHTQKMESIGTLAAGIAHEVGNPLASISALVQVAQRSTEDEFIVEKLGLVKSQITRISKIIRDLVDFSRPSNYELQLTDINKAVNEAVEITKVGTKAKNIQFVTDLSENVPHLPLIADQIQQVFVNILLNAVDAIIEKPDLLGDDSITVKSESEGEFVVLTFSDTGKGIADVNHQKVFEPFFTTKKEGKGTGLGLWVSYGIVKSFQGDIKISSKVNAGTTFTIYLPIQS